MDLDSTCGVDGITSEIMWKFKVRAEKDFIDGVGTIRRYVKHPLFRNVKWATKQQAWHKLDRSQLSQYDVNVIISVRFNDM